MTDHYTVIYETTFDILYYQQIIVIEFVISTKIYSLTSLRVNKGYPYKMKF